MDQETVQNSIEEKLGMENSQEETNKEKNFQEENSQEQEEGSIDLRGQKKFKENKSQGNSEAYYLKSSRVIKNNQLITFVLCAQCQNILYEPKRCKHCSKHVCLTCRGSLSEKKPEENKENVASVCHGSPDNSHFWVEAEVLALQLLSQMEFSCFFSPECNAKLVFSEIKTHEETCEFKRLSCPNKGCSAHLFLREFSSHIETCPFAILTCSHCSQETQRQKHSEHEETCDLKPCKCHGCGNELKQKDYGHHVEKCPEIEERCSLCFKKMKRKELNKHQVTQCLQNQINLVRTQRKIIDKKVRMLKKLHKDGRVCHVCGGTGLCACMIGCSSCDKFFCYGCRSGKTTNWLQKCLSCKNAVCIECCEIHECEDARGNQKENQPVNLQSKRSSGQANRQSLEEDEEPIANPFAAKKKPQPIDPVVL